MKRAANKTNETQECINVTSFEVTRAHYVEGKEGKCGRCFFDAVINGLKIYGLAVVEGKDGDFISWPQKKGSDDKYYSIVWARLSDEDQKKMIETVEKALQ